MYDAVSPDIQAQPRLVVNSHRITLENGQQVQCLASIDGKAISNVLWSLDARNVGKIDASGYLSGFR